MTEFSRYSYFSGDVDKIKIAYVKFLHDLTTQKLLKSVHFWQSYRRKNRMACFWDMVYMSLNLCIAFSLLCLFEIFKADWLWQASSLLRLIVRTGINTPWVKKNKTPNSSLTIFRFSKFFTTRLGSKFATNSCLNTAVVQQLCEKQHVAWKWDLACKERKCGGTSASRDENGQVDVWR